MSEMVVNTSHIILIKLFCIGVCEVLELVFVTGIQIQLEVFSQVCGQIVRLALESPSLQFTGPTVVRHTAWDFVGNLPGMSSP